MEELIPITLFISAALMFSAIYYFRTRENLAMIEKGMNPKSKIKQPAPFMSLKFGLLLIGAGVGLMLAFIIHETMFPDLYDNPAIYFSLIAIGAGIGLITSYKAEKEWLDKHVKQGD